MIALVEVDCNGRGEVGAPAVAQLHDGEGVVGDAELLAEAIGLEYAAVCGELASDAGMKRRRSLGWLTCRRGACVDGRTEGLRDGGRLVR